MLISVTQIDIVTSAFSKDYHPLYVTLEFDSAVPLDLRQRAEEKFHLTGYWPEDDNTVELRFQMQDPLDPIAIAEFLREYGNVDGDGEGQGT